MAKKRRKRKWKPKIDVRRMYVPIPEEGFGSGIKTIRLNLSDKIYLEFLLKLKELNLPISSFFKYVTFALVKNDQKLIDFLVESLKEYNPKKLLKNLHQVQKDNENNKEFEKDFGLNEEEIENIFDILEKEREGL